MSLARSFDSKGASRWLSGKESVCQCRRPKRHPDALEKEMAVHSSILAWRIPQTEKPGRLQSMGSQRVGHDRAGVHTHTLTPNLPPPPTRPPTRHVLAD